MSSTLGDNPTIEAVQAEYDRTACYEETASVSLAKRHRSALLLLMAPHRLVKGGSHGAVRVDHNVEHLRDELQYVRQWIRTHDTGTSGGGVEFFDFGELR